VYNITLLSVRKDNVITPNPAPDSPLIGDCDLIMMGSTDSIRRFLAVLPLAAEP